MDWMLHLTVACHCSGLSSMQQEVGALILCLIKVDGLVLSWNCACLSPGLNSKTAMQAVGQSGSGTTVQNKKKEKKQQQDDFYREFLSLSY